MSVLACLKLVLLGVPDDGAALAAKATLLAEGALARQWAWPRHASLLSPLTFILTDPSALRLDPGYLRGLSSELSRRLLPEGGEAALLLFEGAHREVMRFAASGEGELAALARGEAEGDYSGRLCRISGEGVVSLQPKGGDVGGQEAPAFAASDGQAGRAEPYRPEGDGRLRWTGVYYALKERFVGNALLGAFPGPSAADPQGQDALLDDLWQLGMARYGGVDPGVGLLYIPISFSAALKPRLMEIYRHYLAGVDAGLKARLAANVYDVPREPSQFAVKAIRALLEPAFSVVNFLVEDPAFRVETLKAGEVDSVSLVLKGANDLERSVAIARFAEAGGSYRVQKIWQGVTSLRSQRELEQCRKSRIAFLTGPVVAPVAAGPIRPVAWDIADLPFRAPPADRAARAAG